jgi:hypothetical protein
MSTRDRRDIKGGTSELVCLLILSLLISCVADGAARVRGKVVSVTGQGIDNCVLELYNLKNNELVRKIDKNYGFYRDGEFDLSFTIAPSFQKYYMIIKCEGYSSYYKTGVYEMGGDKYMKNPIDFETIVLEK